MKVFRDIDPLKKYLSECRCKEQTIGLVPTMGALHDGHLSLLNSSIEENNVTICTIYVNPTQFNNSSDFKSYPRHEAADIRFLKEAGCQAVFIPSDSLIYRKTPNLILDFKELENVLEGKHRPGHFNGVGMIVSKLFHIIAPDRAYFGQKDLQQFVIINRLVEDLGFQLELRCVPIKREFNGLAFSSRNLRLNGEQKEKAAEIYRALLEATDNYVEGKDKDYIEKKGTEHLLRHGMKPEYFALVDAETLQPIVNDSSEKRVAVCVAVFVGDVRLIDNVIVQEVGSHAN